MLAVSDVEDELAQEGLMIPPRWKSSRVMKIRRRRVSRILEAAAAVPVEAFIFLEHRLLSRTPLGIVWARTLAFIIRHASF
jgi:hypothetical protein